MAIYPGARWLPLPENDSQPRITPRQVILHTAVTAADSLFGFYNSPGVVVESQFYVARNHVEQYLETTRRADANRQANAWAISIESWDDRDPAHTPWTPTQMDLLVALVAWCCVTHGIPAEFCRAWDAPGIGWHTMWGAPSPWTPVAKTCPGGPRIAQMPELLARVQQTLAAPTPAPPLVPEEDEDVKLIDFVRDPRNGAIFIVHAGVWKRHVTSPEHLDHMQQHYGARGADTTVRDWSPIDLDPIPTAGPAGDIDEAEVARQVLAVLTPEAIADAIPADLAGDVVNVLAQRLGA